MTFSIIGYDPSTEEIGVAVHSKAFSVGSLVPFVQARVGAIATQSLVNVSLGPLGLELFEEGRKPEQVLDHFRLVDQGIEFRQIGFYSIKHGSYSYTGSSCIDWAGSKTGQYYACQGNILTGSEVIDAMAEAFESTQGSLVNRLMSSLHAGATQGGDARGKQSAAIIVEQPGKGRAGYGDRKIDLRVEDAENPITELQRLVEIAQINNQMQELFELSQTNPEESRRQFEQLVKDKKERWMDEAWLALGRLYYSMGQPQLATSAVTTALEINPQLLSILRAYPTLGFGFDEDFVEQFVH